MWSQSPSQRAGPTRAPARNARQAVAGAALDEEFTGGRGRILSLRWVYAHMIEEYARHNGHADLLRQRIDGATGS
jgi:Protein of unknown function (DUF664)